MKTYLATNKTLVGEVNDCIIMLIDKPKASGNKQYPNTHTLCKRLMPN